jgi:hypothetical protein
MEEHTPDNIDAAIEYAVAHDSAFPMTDGE